MLCVRQRSRTFIKITQKALTAIGFRQTNLGGFYFEVSNKSIKDIFHHEHVSLPASG